MYSRNNRVFYDETGRIIYQTGEITKSTNPIDHEPVVGRISFIDVPLGEYDISKGYIRSINPGTREVVFETHKLPVSQAEHIRELEDALLLQAEKETGGIL